MYKSYVIVSFLVSLLLSACASTSVSNNADSIAVIVLPALDDKATETEESLLAAIELKIRSAFTRNGFDALSKHEISGSPGAGNFDVSRPLKTQEWLRLLNVAKSGEKFSSIRAAVFYKTYVYITSESFGETVSVDLLGEVHDIDSGRLLCEFGGDRPISFNVSDDCFSDDRGDASSCLAMRLRRYGSELASAVADKAAACLRRNVSVKSRTTDRVDAVTQVFNFKFEYFSTMQIMNVRSVMETWPGGVKSGKLRGSEPVFRFSYSSKKSKDKILSWLTIVLQDMGLASSDYHIGGNRNDINLLFLGETLPKHGASGEDTKFK